MFPQLPVCDEGSNSPGNVCVVEPSRKEQGLVQFFIPWSRLLKRMMLRSRLFSLSLPISLLSETKQLMCVHVCLGAWMSVSLHEGVSACLHACVHVWSATAWDLAANLKAARTSWLWTKISETLNWKNLSRFWLSGAFCLSNRKLTYKLRKLLSEKWETSQTKLWEFGI